MELLEQYLPWITLGLIVLIALLAMRGPVEWIFRVGARTGVGLFVLMALGKVGELIGIHLGVNLFNALVMGLLGAPGFGLLLMLNWTLLH